MLLKACMIPRIAEYVKMLIPAFLLLLLTTEVESVTNFSSPVEDILNRLFGENGYNRNIRPRSNMHETTTVSIGIYIQSLSSISEINMEYVLDVYFRQDWNDPRLRFNETNETITAGPYYADKLWLPDPYFINSKEETFHTVTVPNILLRISPNGDVFFSQRLSLVMACNMKLMNFPMDDQVCDIKTMSYGYTTKDITLKWMEEGSLSINEENELPEFYLTKTDKEDCTQVYVTGTYSCLAAKFYISRRLEYYLVQTYLPTILIVVLSWVNFWIDPHATPARVSLGLLCVLTMTTQSTGVQAKLPRVSYIKSMDVWLNVCLIFVFGALLEYALVNVQARKQDNHSKKYKVQQNGDGNGNKNGEANISQNGDASELTFGERSCCSKLWLSADRVDLLSRFIFPAAFGIFNLIYWTYYKTRSEA